MRGGWGQSFTNFDSCPHDNSAAQVESAGSPAGIFSAHYASVLLTCCGIDMGGVALFKKASLSSVEQGIGLGRLR